MKQRIGFLGIGQCGGNIASLFESNGYNCLFINTCEQDLNSLPISVKFRFKIRNAEGCNHDRNKAIRYAKLHYKEIINQIQDKLLSCDLIYFCFSTAGGTGSGFAPMLLEMCSEAFPDKYFGCVAVLPSENESPQVQLNAYECYKEISKIEKLASVFTLDNNKQKDKLAINLLFFQRFNAIINIHKFTNTRGNIDKAELFKMLYTRGNAYISECKYTAPDELSANLIKSWEESNVFADIEKDRQIKYLGLSTLHEPQLESLQKYIGTPFDVFQNYHNNNNITILSGLSFPKARINTIIEKIKNNKDIIKRSLENPLDSIADDGLDFLEDIKPKLIPPIIDTKPLDEILKKYST